MSNSDKPRVHANVELTGGPRVVIVEDQRLVAEFLSLHCRSIGIVVVANCGTLAEGMAAIREHVPILALLDFSLPDGNGLEAAKVLLDELPALRIIGISSHRDAWTMLQVQRMGLHGFIDKHEQRPETLTHAIHSVLAGRVSYASIVVEATAALRRDPKAFNRVLSDYEMRILSLIGQSKSDDEIAALLGISPSTVQSRRRDIMRKLDIHTTPKLIHYAIVHGLTRPDQLDRVR
ncbi:MAG: response regulator transcription factor [Candidatus Didemnitutus sp.]|nr:response regulator transcription factor [Candidatus Didemnitutus sp.]